MHFAKKIFRKVYIIEDDSAGESGIEWGELIFRDTEENLNLKIFRFKFM